jgi:hypothetical protein
VGGNLVRWRAFGGQQTRGARVLTGPLGPRNVVVDSAVHEWMREADWLSSYQDAHANQGVLGLNDLSFGHSS